ncbi:MAG: acyl-CoA reductase-like NAD-dependent aldehyde dehydrogenase, partial [Polyangiales bacterium]
MFKTISPIDGSLLLEREFASDKEIDAALHASGKSEWRRMPLEERITAVAKMVDAVVGKTDVLAKELTEQMGRPIRYTPGEIAGFEERARRMIELAPEALATMHPPEKDGFRRFVTREALGTVLVLSPWNYPWLTSVNAFIPALLAGNTVVLKHSEQTPLVAERLQEAALAANLPAGAFQFLHADNNQIAKVVADERIAHICFTGSVEGGRAVHQAAAARFVAMGLELGGKDPAYVREDADFDFAVENLVDGSFFNSGQSCCGVERIYVHQSHHDRFVEAFVAKSKEYVLGDPREQNTTLGPVVRERNALAIQAQIDAAVHDGAQAHIDTAYPGSERGISYLGPQVLSGLNHKMTIMREETFGPVACIMPVEDDAQAVALMNDSRFGLTGSVWSADLDRVVELGRQLETGTVFANRCDALDPDLPWVGVKDSGRGATLGRVGFEHLTRAKSFH